MTEKVKVAVRIRPLPGPTSLLATAALDDKRVCVSNRRVYHADRAFGPNDNSEFIFYDTVASLVDRFLAGYNATVLAYGQTGTGKTYTMSGLTPLVLSYIIESMGGSTSRLSFQYVEVYGESLRDLLTNDPVGSAKHLHLCEGGDDGAVVIVGCSRVKAQNIEEVQQIIDHGARMRATGATNMNLHSSRSHSIFTVFNLDNRSKFHLVDLAGSERNKKTLNVGQRFRESVAINGGLLALGNVIRALSRNHFQSPENPRHVPYRGSKLTRFLQDSLGGNSCTLFIACVASDADNADETTRTLQYSSLAMHVLNEPLPQFDDLVAAEANANEADAEEPLTDGADDIESAKVHALQERVAKLEGQLHTCREELKLDQTTFSQQITEMRRLIDENETLRRRVNFLEGNPTPYNIVPFGATNRNEYPGGDPRVRPSMHWNRQAPSLNPSYAANSLDPRSTSAMGEQQMEQMQPTFPKELQPSAVYRKESFSHSSYSPYAAAAREAATPRVATAAAAVTPMTYSAQTSEREEKLGLIAKEALYYQNSNSELRRRLRVVLSKYEAQQQEIAMLRLEVERFHHLHVIPH